MRYGILKSRFSHASSTHVKGQGLTPGIENAWETMIFKIMIHQYYNLEN